MKTETKEYLIGVDAGRKINVVLADKDLKIIKKLTMPGPRGSYRRILGYVVRAIEELLRVTGTQPTSVISIGIGVGNGQRSSIEKAIRKKFRVNTLSKDSAVCAVLAEKHFNALPGAGILLYLYSDLGRGAVIADDRLEASSEDSAYLKPWDDALSIVNLAKKDVERGVGTKIVSLAGADMDRITEDVVVTAAAEHDEVAFSVMQRVSTNLALRTAYLVNIFNPRAVIIGGNVERTGEFILGPVKKIVAKLSLRGRAETVKIIPGTLGEDAVSLGAALLAAKEELWSSGPLSFNATSRPVQSRSKE